MLGSESHPGPYTHEAKALPLSDIPAIEDVMWTMKRTEKLTIEGHAATRLPPPPKTDEVLYVLATLALGTNKHELWHSTKFTQVMDLWGVSRQMEEGLLS